EQVVRRIERRRGGIADPGLELGRLEHAVAGQEGLGVVEPQDDADQQHEGACGDEPCVGGQCPRSRRSSAQGNPLRPAILPLRDRLTERTVPIVGSARLGGEAGPWGRLAESRRMGSLLAGKFATMWEINVQAGREHPVLFSIYLAVLLAFAAAAIVLIWRRQARGAFWCAVVAILGGFSLSWGDDSFTHVYRIAALADQVRTGPLSAFL